MPKDLRIKAKLPTADDYKAFEMLCVEMGYTNRSECAGKIILDRIRGRSVSQAAQLPLEPLPKVSPAMIRRRELRKELANQIESHKQALEAFLCLAAEHLSPSGSKLSSLSSEFDEFAQTGFEEIVKENKGLIQYVGIDGKQCQTQITAGDQAAIKTMLGLQHELASVERKVLNE